ncbi:hypothetical protein CHLRE_17g722050v5 [Chlamydomonas reinhardtii]|uniref:Histone deacetylase complex subunit SAP30 Sin3 binding domain-containing protein n=1 Tax=Chlamydomonas reinhardtii TaxID=3055 RepID=A0A2K3CQD0_CHLRE|nr:uncharacterized protein CHLRE_17g722050v5 [Chlamydomonas reinhardtii]PNW70488.1 hypothetical protein CHLRE_17g722050v5 [Chlamydomonas reinhardtii]
MDTDPRRGSSQFGTPATLRPRLNFGKLDVNSLKRYQRVHKLVGVPQTASKEQLVSAVTRHFSAQVVSDELKVIAAFVTAVQKRQTLSKK